MLSTTQSYSSQQFSIAASTSVTTSLAPQSTSPNDMMMNHHDDNEMNSLAPSTSIVSTAKQTKANQSKLTFAASKNKAPPQHVDKFQMLLEALDYINGASYPKLTGLGYKPTHMNSSKSNTLLNGEEDDDSDNGDQKSQGDLDEDEKKMIADEVHRFISSRSSSRHKKNGHTDEDDDEYMPQRRSNQHDDEDEDESEEEETERSSNTAAHQSAPVGGVRCCCCKRDASSVSFQKNYSIHAGNIDNYQNTFPEYDVVPGVSCMTCYHKQWRYSKGLYDPSKARAQNKREGVQPRGSKKTPSTGAIPNPSFAINKKKTSPKRKKEDDLEVSITEEKTRKQRKITRRKQQAEDQESTSPNSNSSQPSVTIVNNTTTTPNMIDPVHFTTSTYSPSPLTTASSNNHAVVQQSPSAVNNSASPSSADPQHHQTLRLTLKFIWLQSEDSRVEVFSCPLYCDFVPTSLVSIKSIVMGKLKNKMSGYECESITVTSPDGMRELNLSDTELRNRCLRYDDVLNVYVK